MCTALQISFEQLPLPLCNLILDDTDYGQTLGVLNWFRAHAYSVQNSIALHNSYCYMLHNASHEALYRPAAVRVS